MAKTKRAKKAPKLSRPTAAKRAVAKKAPAKKASAKAKKTKTGAADGLQSLSRVHAYELFGNTRPVAIPNNQGPNFYCVLEAVTPRELAFLVQTKMNEAWIPTGGIGNHDTGLFQAMIKY